MIEHNKNFYSLEELKRTRDSLEGFSDNEEVYYFVGAIRYACDEIERLNNIITELEKYCETRLSIFEQMTDEQREEQLDKYKIYDIFLSRIKELKGDSSNE